MMGQPDLAEEDEFQLVVSADGSPLLIADSQEAVGRVALRQELRGRDAALISSPPRNLGRCAPSVTPPCVW
jgi:hypothetical protein